MASGAQRPMPNEENASIWEAQVREMKAEHQRKKMDETFRCQKMAALKLQNEQLTLQLSNLQGKYNDLEERFSNEPTIQQQQPTNYEAVCAELDSSKEENSRLLGRIKELEMQIKEKDEKAKQNLQKLLNDIHVMSNN